MERCPRISSRDKTHRRQKPSSPAIIRSPAPARPPFPPRQSLRWISIASAPESLSHSHHSHAHPQGCGPAIHSQCPQAPQPPIAMWLWAISPAATHSRAPQPPQPGQPRQPRLHSHGSKATHSRVAEVAVVPHPPLPDFQRYVAVVSYGQTPPLPDGCGGCGATNHVTRPRNHGCGWLRSDSHHSHVVVVAVFTAAHSHAHSHVAAGPVYGRGWLCGGRGWPWQPS